LLKENESESRNVKIVLIVHRYHEHSLISEEVYGEMNKRKIMQIHKSKRET